MTDSIETTESEALPWQPSASQQPPARALRAASTPQSGPLFIDLKQATDLLAMFGGEPSEITLQVTAGRSGNGLYAHYTEYPEEGAIFLGKTDIEAVPDSAPSPAVFQQRVRPWLLECFGEAIAGDRMERNHRFLEEALELVQACGCTASEAHQLVDYTFGRPVGEKAQEVGGVMVTLAALCLAQDIDMHAEGETELARISAPDMVNRIRAKQAAKPKHSPLPATPATCRLADGRCGICGGDWSVCGCDGMLRRAAAKGDT